MRQTTTDIDAGFDSNLLIQIIHEILRGRNGSDLDVKTLQSRVVGRKLQSDVECIADRNGQGALQCLNFCNARTDFDAIVFRMNGDCNRLLIATNDRGNNKRLVSIISKSDDQLVFSAVV